MPIDITRNIDRFEAQDTNQFTLTMSANRPNTVVFIVFNTNGNTLAPEAMQSSSLFVAESGASTGIFYLNRVLPTTVGFYTYEWRAWDGASRTYIVRGEFEVIHTQAHSFFTYSDVPDVLRTARQIFGRGDITIRDLRPYCEAGDGWIDAKLGGVVTVPLGSASALIKDMSKVYCLYNYYSDRYSVEKEAAPPAIVQRRERYDELLDAVAAGSATIAGVTLTDQEDISALPGDYKPVFDLRDFTDQRIDPDLIDAEADRDT